MELVGGRVMWDLAQGVTRLGSLIVGKGIHFSEVQFLPSSFGGDDGDAVTPDTQGSCDRCVS